MTVVVEGVLAIDVPDDCPSTIESRAGIPDVHRFFLDPVVAAASVRSDAEDAAAAADTAAGDLLAEYRGRPGYERRSRPTPTIPGATEVHHLEFQWESEGGQLMRSAAVVAAGAGQVVIVHATLPELFGDDVFATADNLVLSARLQAPEDVYA